MFGGPCAQLMAAAGCAYAGTLAGRAGVSHYAQAHCNLLCMCCRAPCHACLPHAVLQPTPAAMLCVLLQEAAGTAMPPPCSAPVDDDVAAEQDRMRALLAQRIGEGGTAAAQLNQGMHKRQGTRRIRVPAAAAGNVSAARQCADSNVSATRRAWLSALVRGTAAAQLAAGFVGGAVLVVTE